MGCALPVTGRAGDQLCACAGPARYREGGDPCPHPPEHRTCAPLSCPSLPDQPSPLCLQPPLPPCSLSVGKYPATSLATPAPPAFPLGSRDFSQLPFLSVPGFPVPWTLAGPCGATVFPFKVPCLVLLGSSSGTV